MSPSGVSDRPSWVLRDKALSNLRAGEALLAVGLVDPAASRLYYACYQAAVHRLTLVGRTPGATRSGAVEWDHSMMKNNAGSVRGRRSDGFMYEQVRDLRRIADYSAAECVTEGMVRALLPWVREFVVEAAR
jgi:uncharacterized protein (UPF0332 family)